MDFKGILLVFSLVLVRLKLELLNTSTPYLVKSVNPNNDEAKTSENCHAFNLQNDRQLIYLLTNLTTIVLKCHHLKLFVNQSFRKQLDYQPLDVYIILSSLI